MAPGERVRVRYVHAMRMVSVVWRGGPTSWARCWPADIAHTRFGVAVTAGNAMRITNRVNGVCACARPAMPCDILGFVFAVRLQRAVCAHPAEGHVCACMPLEYNRN